jgi:hypothetical protein
MPGATCFRRKTSAQRSSTTAAARGHRRQLAEQHEKAAIDETGRQIVQGLALDHAHDRGLSLDGVVADGQRPSDRGRRWPENFHA